jgi:uncharacterized phage protein gp47/JayE
MSGLTSTGFELESINSVKTEIEDALKAQLGPAINLVAPSVFATIIGIMAEREALIWQVAEDVYNSQYPDTASGTSLDNVVALTGISRLKATPTRHPGVLLFGTAGTTIPLGTQLSVQGSPGTVFTTDTPVTLVSGVNAVQQLAFSAVPAAGSFTLTFRNENLPPLSFAATAADLQAALNGLNSLSQTTVTGSMTAGFNITFAGVNGTQPQPVLGVHANTLLDSGNSPVTILPTLVTAGTAQGSVAVTATNTGALPAPARSITVINTPVAGLSAVLNQDDATIGRYIESDSELRVRRQKTLQVGGSSTPDAIRSKLLALPGVTDVFVFENITLLPDQAGRPPKSYEVVVNGGVDSVVTQTIWNTKPAGIQTDGSIQANAVDSQGATQFVRWSRPTVVPIYVEFDIQTDFTFPSNGAQLVTQAILDFGASLRISQSVVVSPALISAVDDIPGIVGLTVKIGTAPGPTLSSNIQIATAQIASFDTSRITVVIS